MFFFFFELFGDFSSKTKGFTGILVFTVIFNGFFIMVLMGFYGFL